ncbi:hypothetical protein DFH29DRAFT_1044613 [Suillus ampliporus]|nr:hypothetical protein DFH29DRAFT_1044613 [Suillus ampliporus]
MPTLFDSTKFSSATTLETLPDELLLEIISEVILSSTRPDHNKLQQSLPIAGTTRTGRRRRAKEIPSGIHAVGLTSRRLHNLANTVLYRTVVLDREKDVLLFRRTVDGAREAGMSAKTGEVAITSAFLQNAVKRLAITHAPMYTDLTFVFTLLNPGTKVSNSDIAAIITACSGARTIAIPSQWALVLFSSALMSISPKHACTIPPIARWRPSAPSTPIHSLPATPSTTRPSTPDHIMRHDSASASNNPSSATIFHHITHLCIAEPAYAWCSPLALLKVFPSLTHVALPRRAHANTENDKLFMEDVKAILQEPRMEVIVITIFPQILARADKEHVADHDASRSLDIKDSTIWLAAEELRKRDGRLFIVNGHTGSWRKDWQGPAVVANPKGPRNWWRKAMSA